MSLFNTDTFHQMTNYVRDIIFMNDKYTVVFSFLSIFSVIISIVKKLKKLSILFIIILVVIFYPEISSQFMKLLPEIVR